MDRSLLTPVLDEGQYFVWRNDTEQTRVQAATGLDCLTEPVTAARGNCRIPGAHDPHHQWERAGLGLLGARSVVRVVVVTLPHQCRQVLGPEIDFQEPAIDERTVGVNCGLDVQVGFQNELRAADADVRTPLGRFDIAAH
jgi:hypothetical protein